jgi:hypothetical protein
MVAELPMYWHEDDARGVIEDWRASGLSMAAFARQHGLRVERIRRWRRRIEDEPSEPRFVRLVVREPENEAEPLWVHVGSARIEVPRGFDEETLLRLIRTLSC